MKKLEDRSSKKCINPWFQFLTIFCVAALTLFLIFEVNTNQVKFNFFKRFFKEESDDYILIAASGVDPNSSVAIQFETCQNFIVINESSDEFEYYSNNPSSYNINTLRYFVREKKVETVIAGTMEIGTYRMLNSSHIDVYTGVTGTVEDALKRYKKHKLVSFSRHYYDRRINTSVDSTGNSKSVRRAKF